MKKTKKWIIYQNTETSETVYYNENLMFACVDNRDDEKTDIEGALFFSSSQLYTRTNIKFPLKFTVSLVSVFLADYPKMFFFM